MNADKKKKNICVYLRSSAVKIVVCYNAISPEKTSVAGPVM
jgi:hypothetical protein